MNRVEIAKPLGARVRFQVLHRDRFTCQYCGARAPHVRLEVDHVVPRVRGGSDDPANLVTACFTCNQGKHASELDMPTYDELVRALYTASLIIDCNIHPPIKILCTLSGCFRPIDEIAALTWSVVRRTRFKPVRAEQ